MTNQPAERPPSRADRRTDVFGEVVPGTSRDERPQTWGDAVEDSEEALRREVPPHHG